MINYRKLLNYYFLIDWLYISIDWLNDWLLWNQERYKELWNVAGNITMAAPVVCLEGNWPEMASSIFLRAPNVVMPSSFRSWSVSVRNVWRSIWETDTNCIFSFKLLWGDMGDKCRIKPVSKCMCTDHCTTALSLTFWWYVYKIKARTIFWTPWCYLWHLEIQDLA